MSTSHHAALQAEIEALLVGAQESVTSSHATLQAGVNARQKKALCLCLDRAVEPWWLPWVQMVGAALIGVAIGVYVP
jgi:hypothetical protein